MKQNFLLTLFCSLLVLSGSAQLINADKEKVKGGTLTIQPIKHATLVLSYNKLNIYIDPTGGDSAFKGLPAPDMILVTDIHGDHFDPKQLKLSTRVILH